MNKTVEQVILLVCRLGAAGLAPKAPGTWGTALAVLFAPMFFLPFSVGNRILVLAAVFLLGGLAAGQAEKIIGRKDPSQVVIDELLGIWAALVFFATPSLGVVFLAFILFRILDIAKPWPIRASEKWLPGGFGIMIDDLLAGLISGCIIWVYMLF